MKKTKDWQVVPTAEEHIAELHAVLDSVARERKYLAMLKAFPLESTAEFVRACIRDGHPHFVALRGSKVVGWCDIQRMPRETQAHGGVLGMGILDGHREAGIGTALMKATLEAARKAGFARIELTVRADNRRAQRLYEKAGFKVEGVKRKAALHDGEYFDLLLMALLFEP
jgi:RimJ/RimL family protein N-acetyltransferase